MKKEKEREREREERNVKVYLRKFTRNVNSFNCLISSLCMYVHA